MNHIVVVGHLKSDAKMDGNCLRATVVVRKQGFGTSSDKVFEKWIKVNSYGRDNETVLPQLREGVMVECSGEAEAEAYQSTKGEKKWFASVVIRGMGAIRPLLMPGDDSDRGGDSAPAPAYAQASRPAQQPKEQQAPAASGESEVTF